MGGERWNPVEHAVLTSTNEDTAFPRTNLYLGRPRLPFRFNDNTTDPVSLTCDINRIVLVTAGVPVNAGDFTTWSAGVPQGWTAEAGAAVTQISPGRDGTGSLLQISGTGSVVYDLVVRPGEAWRFTGWLRRSPVGGVGVAFFRVRNLQTGMYLTSAGAWQVAVAQIATNATTVFAQYNQNFVIESLAACSYAEKVTLRIECLPGGAAAADDADYDDVYVFPAVDLGSIHGHNIDAQIVTALRSSDDNVTYSTEATFTKRRPSFYARLGALTYHRFWRFNFDGGATANQSGKIYFFPVLGQTTAWSRGAPRVVDVDTLYAQTRNETGARERFVHNHGGEAQRAVTVGFQHLTTAQWEELLLPLFGTQQGGAFPGVFIPLDDEPLIVHGRIAPNLGADRVFRDAAAANDIRRHELMIQESAFPLVVA